MDMATCSSMNSRRSEFHDMGHLVWTFSSPNTSEPNAGSLPETSPHHNVEKKITVEDNLDVFQNFVDNFY